MSKIVGVLDNRTCYNLNMLNIYNTETRNKVEFKPLKEGKISYYVCGITPYDSPHLGHLLSAIRFNVIRQYLSYSGYKVTFVQNITDVSDKIVARSLETGEKPDEIASKYVEEYENALKTLGIPKADFSPKVSEYIPEIIEYIKDLIKKDYAYVTKAGNVYFDISKKDDYGKLSGRNKDELRNDVDEDKASDKKSPGDFTLWKSETMDGMKWKSPWGEGRPGWHIECSVMSNTLLGNRIDLHGGGIDLIFPHHENEICQCEAHNGYGEGESFVQNWLHSGVLTVGGVKMSKSLGNFVTAEDGLKKYGPELLKYVLLKTQYRSPINLDDSIFIENINNLYDIYKTLREAKRKSFSFGFLVRNHPDIVTGFKNVMDNDFNTSNALVVFSEAIQMLKGAIKENNRKEIRRMYWTIKRLGKVLFLFQEKDILPQLLTFVWNINGKELLTLEYIEDKLKEMKKARKHKDYDKSDEIRDELLERGIAVMQGEGDIDWKFQINSNRGY
jgi:cysteinyl-tRNA synthetase